MIPLVNPYVILAALLALAGTHWYAYSKGGEHEANAQKAAELVRKETFDQAMAATAEAISKLEVRHTTIRQVVEKEIYERPVYRDCRHSDDTLRMLNESLTLESVTAGGGELPKPDAAGRRDVRRNDPQAARGDGNVLPLPRGGAGAGR